MLKRVYYGKDPEIKKWIKTKLPKINLLGFGVCIETTDPIWFIGIGAATGEHLYVGESRLYIRHDCGTEKIIFERTPDHKTLAVYILAICMENLDRVTAHEEARFEEFYHTYKFQFDTVHARVKEQIWKIQKSSRLQRIRRKTQRDIIRTEFKAHFATWDKNFRLVRKDEIFDICSSAMDELKVAEVMEA